MSPLQHMLNRARRRRLINRAVRKVGYAVVAGAGVGMSMVLADRVAGLAISPWVFWIAPAVAAVLAVVHAWWRQPDVFATAVAVDHAMRLNDRIATAASLRDSQTRMPRDEEFAALVEAQAQSLAASPGLVDVRTATPIRITPIWFAAGPALAALWAAVMFVPPLDQWKGVNNSELAMEDKQIQQQAAEISQAINNAVAESSSESQLDQRDQEDLDALNRLAEQLAQKAESPQALADARDESAARLNEVADRLAARSQRDLAAADEVAQRFRSLDETGAPKPPMSAKEFSEALKRGDFAGAARNLEDLLNAQNLSEADRRAAADHLRQLAAHADSAKPEPANPQELKEQLAQTLRDQGIDEQTLKQFLDHPPSPEELEQRLREKNIDEDLAHQIAEEMQQQREQQEVNKEVNESLQDVKDSLNKAADDLENPPPPPEPQSAQPEPKQEQPKQQQPKQEQPARSPEQQSQDQPAHNQQDQQKQQQNQPQAKPADSTSQSQQQSDKQQSRDQQQSTNRDGTQPQADQQQRQTSPSRTQSTNQQREGQPQGDNTQPANKPDKNQQTQTRSSQQTAGDQQSQERNQSATSRTAQNTERKSQSKSQSSPVETLRRLAERRTAAADRQRMSERLRQAARELAQGSRPGANDFRQWEKSAQRELASADKNNQKPDGRAVAQQAPRQQNQKGGSGPGAGDGPEESGALASSERLEKFQTQDVDLRGRETADQLIAEWLSDQQMPTGAGAANAASAASSGRVGSTIRQAQDVAERAVNEDAVQRRYHKAIQRYFGRLNETVKSAAEPEKPGSK